MGLSQQLLFIIYSIIDDCKEERIFNEFVECTRNGEGWKWIFRQGSLGSLVRLPSSQLPWIRPTSAQIEPLVHLLWVTKNWKLWSLEDDIQRWGLRMARERAFIELASNLAVEMSTSRYMSTHLAHGKTMIAKHEGGVVLHSLLHPAYSAWLLSGDTTAQFEEAAAALEFLKFLDIDTSKSLDERLAAMDKGGAAAIFDKMKGFDSSCLVGVMVADVSVSYGRVVRLVSLSRNLCGSIGKYTAHKKSGQDSQIHMEIFSLERLEALLDVLATSSGETLHQVDVAMLGLKTSTVVSENALCEACEKVRARVLDGHAQLKGATKAFNANFLKS